MVVYDGAGLFSAARVWWTFRAFGHDEVRVLDGGLPRWRAEGRPVEAGAAATSPATFTATLRPALVRAPDDVRATTDQVVDARSRGRFEGTVPEPRPNLRGGHIPGSRNLPFNELLEDGRLRSADALQLAFHHAGVDPSRGVFTTCGSGVTAAVLALALRVLGQEDVAVYDGSWTEWGGRTDTPVSQGPAGA